MDFLRKETGKNRGLTTAATSVVELLCSGQRIPSSISGSLSKSYRRCGNPDCRCHRGGPKHGPHLYISYRGTTGKTTGYYVPHHAEAQIRHGVEAWSQLQDHLRELAALNKEHLIPTRPKK